VNTNGPKAKRAPADVGTGWLERRVDSNPNGAPLLDWWLINSDGYSGSHYATFPPELVIPLVQAMTPYRVCRKCGQPSRRITSETTYERNGEPCEADAATFAGLQERRANVGHSTAVRDTIGWSDCGHDDWRAGHVLDPFAGSGTSLMVAHGHGRAVTGIDLDERNAWLIRDRLGMFLTVE
jgi:hypothetical protein